MGARRDPNRVDTASLVVQASAARVYEALLDRESLLRWLPPEGMTARIDGFDARVGGGYRMTLTYADPQAARGKTSERTDVVNVRFTALEQDRRLVQEVCFDSPDPAYDEPMDMTWDLLPEAEGTRVRITCRNVPAAISATDHDAGMRSSLANLAGYLESRPDRRGR